MRDRFGEEVVVEDFDHFDSTFLALSFDIGEWEGKTDRTDLTTFLSLSIVTTAFNPPTSSNVRIFLDRSTSAQRRTSNTPNETDVPVTFELANDEVDGVGDGSGNAEEEAAGEGAGEPSGFGCIIFRIARRHYKASSKMSKSVRGITDFERGSSSE